MNDNNATFIEPEGPDQLEPGLLLNDEYELIKQVGRGGMGVVWKAKDRSGERHVALKFVPPDVQRFETEMARVRQSFASIHDLQHQHICPVYALKQHPIFGYYLVMKWIEGETLDHFLLRHDGGMDLETVVKILEPIAAALDYAHSRKIIHRDVKPSNIFVQMDGTEVRDVQLIDFGLAKEIRSSLVRVSEMGADIAGTQLYMSPEQWRGRRQTAATDQYALAVVAYEMLAGYPPFESDDKDILRRAVLEETPDEIEGAFGVVNDALLKGLAKDAVDRYGSCREFITQLSVGVYFEQGKTHYKTRKYDLAIADYTEAIRISPNCAEAYINRGYIRSLFTGPIRGEPERRREDLAIPDYTEAIRIKPDYAFAYVVRGNFYLAREEYDLAIADFTEAIRIKPNEPNYAVAYVNRGLSYAEKGEYDLAITDCTAAMRIRPNYNYAFRSRGNIYSMKGVTDLAIADFTEAIRICPDDERAFQSRGEIYFEIGEYDLAIADSTKAIRFGFNPVLLGPAEICRDAHIICRDAYGALGKLDLAKAHNAEIDYLTDCFEDDWVTYRIPLPYRYSPRYSHKNVFNEDNFDVI